ncbi:MAG: thioesterase domain-containing protein [Oscillospiraceae bacterium]|nr:thioesterase domain-containing protein [Oscillospiraceae bacterium]
MCKKQIFCFPFAGGTSAFYDQIEKDLPAYELVKMEYPGHGTRHKEPLLNDFSMLADDVFSHMQAAYHGGDYALFGYSMGTITLSEVLRRIILSDMPLPRCVFLAAHEPQTFASLADYQDEGKDEEVIRRTIAFGTVPEKLIDNKTFWRTYLPLLKADYAMIGKYRFEDLKLQTNIPAWIFYSEEDTKRCDMEGWRKYFQGVCEYQAFEGSHFFIRNYHEAMAETIQDAFI